MSPWYHDVMASPPPPNNHWWNHLLCIFCHDRKTSSEVTPWCHAMMSQRHVMSRHDVTTSCFVTPWRHNVAWRRGVMPWRDNVMWCHPMTSQRVRRSFVLEGLLEKTIWQRGHGEGCQCSGIFIKMWWHSVDNFMRWQIPKQLRNGEAIDWHFRGNIPRQKRRAVLLGMVHFCGRILKIWTMFGFRWVGGLWEILFGFRGGWVGHQKFEHCSDF